MAYSWPGTGASRELPGASECHRQRGGDRFLQDWMGTYTGRNVAIDCGLDERLRPVAQKGSLILDRTLALEFRYLATNMNGIVSFYYVLLRGVAVLQILKYWDRVACNSTSNFV